MKHYGTIKVSQEVANEMQTYCDHADDSLPRESRIFDEEYEFPNGMMMAVQVCSCTIPSADPCWTQGVLYSKSNDSWQEVACTEVGDAFLDTYVIEYDGDEYHVKVEVEEAKEADKPEVHSALIDNAYQALCAAWKVVRGVDDRSTIFGQLALAENELEDGDVRVFDELTARETNHYLAIGIRYDEASGEVHTFSYLVETNDPQQISNILTEQNCGVAYDQILVVKNDHPCPTVVAHYNFDPDGDTCDKCSRILKYFIKEDGSGNLEEVFGCPDCDS